MVKEFVYTLHTHLFCGLNSVEKVVDGLKIIKCKKPLVISDKGLQEAGIVTKVTDILKKNNYSYALFTDVETNPTDLSVEEGGNIFKSESCDSLIAVGGGSPIDVAKSVAIIVTNGGKINDYEGFNIYKTSPAPLIAIPTTAGTGSEITKGAVITDTKRHFKMVIAGDTMYPEVAILDATLLESLPPFITAAAGMDALTHAIEGYISRGANIITDTLNLKAIGLIADNLRKAVSTGDLEALNNMLLGSFITGMGFHNSGVGLVHAMAAPVSGIYNIHHGVANAILLPHVMEYNLITNLKKYTDIALAMKENIEGLSLREAAEKAIVAVKKMMKDLNLPLRLSDAGVKDPDFEKMAVDAMATCDAPPNPRRYTKEDIVGIFSKAF